MGNQSLLTKPGEPGGEGHVDYLSTPCYGCFYYGLTHLPLFCAMHSVGFEHHDFWVMSPTPDLWASPPSFFKN